MSSFTGSQKNTFETESAAPHIVICCPSCATKFAVESSAVVALEVPRFHCSRCDTVFLMKEPAEHPAQEENKLQQSQARWVLADPAKTIENADHVASAVAATPFKPTDFSIGSGKWEAPIEALPFEPDAKSQPSKEAAKAMSMSAGLSLLAQGEANLDSQRSAGGFVPTQPQRTQIPASRPNHRAENPLRSSGSMLSASTAAISAEQEEMLIDAGRSAAQGLLGRAAKRFSPRTRGLLKLSWPLCTAMAFLVLLSYSARISPRSTGALLGIVVPSALSQSVPELPPNVLTIRDLSLKFVRTPSRDVVAVVSGKLFNASNKSIHDVTLEALGFNERGETIISAKAPLHSALAGEKVSDLERETIIKFQHSLGAKDASIAPSELVPFTVALLTESALEETGKGPLSNEARIKFFSARVFSVH